MQTEQKWNFQVVFNRLCCHGNYENVKFYPSIKIFHQLFFTCQVSACELQPFFAMIWQMTYTHKLPKLCSATLMQGTFVASIKWTGLRKQLTFHGATTGLPTKWRTTGFPAKWRTTGLPTKWRTTGFPAKWRLRNERKKFHTDDTSLPRSGYCFWLV